MKIKDRREMWFALAGTAEEMFVDVVRKFRPSYKDLPFNIYQFSLKFVPELKRELVDIERQVLLTRAKFSDNVDKHLFGRTSQRKPEVTPVFDFHQFKTCRLSPAGFLPKRERMQYRRQHFLCTRLVHFLTDYIHDFQLNQLPE